jgi:pimeloyl-ACP methyl ester carboxylesterase
MQIPSSPFVRLQHAERMPAVETAAKSPLVTIDTTVSTPQQAQVPHDVPAWFRNAVEHPRTAHQVAVEGVDLHVAGWNAGDIDKAPLLLVHGFRANAHWWDHIAPFLVPQHRVFALDLSGMGCSGRRQAYAAHHFAEDIAGAARWLKGATPELPLTVVGHSYGGSRLLEVCAGVRGLIDHAIVLDSPMPLHGFPTPRAVVRGRSQPHLDRDSILARYRLSPEQPALPYARTYVAEHSITALCDGKWGWQFDPGIGDALGGVLERDDELAGIANRVDVVRGERSAVVSAGLAARIAALLPKARGPVEIPEAHHHPMLDHPLALVSVLRALLA